MNENLVELATSQGIWAVLFLMLLGYVMRTSEKREIRILKDKEDIIERNRAREDTLKAEMNEREKASNEHHNKTIESLEAITRSNTQLAETVRNIDNRLEKGFKEVWEKLKD